MLCLIKTFSLLNQNSTEVVKNLNVIEEEETLLLNVLCMNTLFYFDCLVIQQLNIQLWEPYAVTQMDGTGWTGPLLCLLGHLLCPKMGLLQTFVVICTQQMAPLLGCSVPLPFSCLIVTKLGVNFTIVA